MGKASRRRRPGADTARARTAPVPFARRPFEGLPLETAWAALREVLPAATAVVPLRQGAGEGLPERFVLASVLPMSWAALHRADGTVLVGAQTGATSGDASRDLAGQLLAAAALEPGTPVVTSVPVTAETPRLQDLVEPAADLDVEVHEGFDFWVEGQELSGEAKESLEHANEAVVPTVPLAALPSAYWVRVSDRTYIRLVLPDDEDAATDALARLHAAGLDALGDGTRLLGAFRTSGLLIPVWEVPPETTAADHEGALGAWGERYAVALASGGPLTAEERRARSGLLSRQVTLR
ncbi:MAG TPA: DUF5926 family protein [Dermatophilaceae bacterium]|nr:DUF5926 family protein [Dermatophilaceae bacterium]